MAEAVGKKVFKRHLDLFLAPLFNTLSRITTSQLARHAAVSCVRQLSTFVGPSIFRGRLNDSQRQVSTHGLQLFGPMGRASGRMMLLAGASTVVTE